jgi:DNA-binding GntR family transcriptional regulator
MADTRGAGDGGVMPVQRPASLREVVYDALARLIISGGLAPGQHIVEGELARQLGVSRQPVREALHRLEAEGWVDVLAGQGAFVHEPTDAEVDQLLSVRTLLESEAARLAARSGGPEFTARLRAVLDRGTAAVSTMDTEALVAANSDLHALVIEASGNAVLAEMLALVDRRMRWYYTPIALARAEESWREHAELVEALAAGDARRAGEVTRRHIERTRRAYHARPAGARDRTAG